jgi:hypothetical protein
VFVLTFVISRDDETSSIPDPVAFGRQYMGPLLELLLGWVLLVYGVLRLLGRAQAEQPGRYVGGGLALAAGCLFLGHACGRF